MVLNELALAGFRNYEIGEVSFSPKINIIAGENAQGKTNLLEAVYYLSSGKSFRARSDREVIGFDKDEAKIRASVISHDRQQKIELTLARGRKKTVLINGVKAKTLSDLSERMNAVIFCPSDLNLISDAPAYRRRLLDRCICQLRPKYYEALTEYGRLLAEKQKILKSSSSAMYRVLDEYNDRLCEVGAVLIFYRAFFVKKLAAYAENIHGEFSGDREKLNITYKTVSTVPDPEKRPYELVPYLQQHMKVHARAERETEKCLSGAHKDDLEISVNGAPARAYASQGQMRTAAISLKLAEREILFEETREYPLLLLDDVLSELDAARQSFLLNKITSGQVFITCCEDKSIAGKTGGKVFTVSGGTVREGSPCI